MRPLSELPPVRHMDEGAVVDYLSRALSIPAGEIVTIGDMPNDSLMFQRSGFGIAMGNAGPDVHEAADAVTDSCDDEGFAKAVERFVLWVGESPRLMSPI